MLPRSIFKLQADLCKCLSSAVRIEIVHILRDGPLRVSEIARIIGLPHSTVSQHLRLLRGVDLVVGQRYGQDVVYQIANPKIINICDLMRDVLKEDASRRTKLLEGLQNEPAE